MPIDLKLYIAADTDAPFFKIGVSASPGSRMSALGINIDHGRSYIITFLDRSAYKYESFLHRLFQSNRITRGNFEGGSEWFENSAYDEVREFLIFFRHRLGFSEFEAFPPPKPRAPRTPRGSRRMFTEDEILFANSCSLMKLQELKCIVCKIERSGNRTIFYTPYKFDFHSLSILHARGSAQLFPNVEYEHPRDPDIDCWISTVDIYKFEDTIDSELIPKIQSVIGQILDIKSRLF